MPLLAQAQAADDVFNRDANPEKILTARRPHGNVRAGGNQLGRTNGGPAFVMPAHNEGRTTMSHIEQTTTTEAVAPRKKRRIFLWVFLAVQALFIIWLIAGGSSASDTSDCVGQYADACKTGTAVGTGIGIFLILALWCIVDFLLAVGYVIYRVARRP